MPRKNPNPYPPGPMPEVGLHVIARIADGPGTYWAERTRYAVRQLCCDTLISIRHRAIRQRFSEGRDECRNCSVSRAMLERSQEAESTCSFDYDKWVTPPWPVPESLRDERHRSG